MKTIKITGEIERVVMARRCDPSRLEIETDHGYVFADAEKLGCVGLPNLAAHAVLACPSHARILDGAENQVAETIHVDEYTMRLAYRYHGSAYPSIPEVKRVRELANQARNACNCGLPSAFPAIGTMAAATSALLASDVDATPEMWKRFSSLHRGTPEGNAAVGWGTRNAWRHG